MPEKADNSLEDFAQELITNVEAYRLTGEPCWAPLPPKKPSRYIEEAPSILHAPFEQQFLQHYWKYYEGKLERFFEGYPTDMVKFIEKFLASEDSFHGDFIEWLIEGLVGRARPLGLAITRELIARRFR